MLVGFAKWFRQICYAYVSLTHLQKKTKKVYVAQGWVKLYAIGTPQVRVLQAANRAVAA